MRAGVIFVGADAYGTVWISSRVSRVLNGCQTAKPSVCFLESGTEAHLERRPELKK